MIKQWFNARELAELSLTNTPKTKKGVILKAQREGWESRPREGKGGGFEYNISSLPPEAQIDLLNKTGGSQTLRTLKESMEAYEGLTPVGKTEFDTEFDIRDRKNAKIIIVGIFNDFRRERNLTLAQAEAQFLAYYRSRAARGDYSVIGQWVFAALPDFSTPSLRRWRKAYEKLELKRLEGRYGNRKGGSILSRAEGGKVAMFIAATLASQPQLKAGHIRDLVRANFGTQLNMANETTGGNMHVHLPKIRAFERYIAEWKAGHAQAHQKMVNPDGYKNHNQMALGSQSQAAEGLNHVWEIDASPVDALCVDGRYTLYAITDVWSRRAMFMVSKTAKTEASLQMVRRAIMAWGVPETLKTDNGSDFKSHRFQTALAALGIKQKLCPPYTPEGKPHVERVIKTIQHQLMPLLPGYVGHNVAERSQIEARKSFAQKLGVDDRNTFMISMDHNQLYDLICQWALDKYNMTPHSALSNMTPFAKAASWEGEVRRVNNERALHLLLAPIAGTDGWRTITKKALRINGRHYYGPGLELHVGRRVMVRHDYEDMARVYVFDEDNQFLCEATDYEAMGAEERSALAAQVKANQKAAIRDEVIALRRAAREYDLTPETITKTILDQATADREHLSELPRPSVEHSTPALRGAEEAVDGAVFAEKTYMPMLQPAPPPMSKSDEWWERRKRIILAQLRKEVIPEEDVTWLEYYEATPEFRSRDYFQKLLAEQMGETTPPDDDDNA